MAQEALKDVSFYLRPAHLEKLAFILEDPEASDNDRFVAHTLLKILLLLLKESFQLAKTQGLLW